MYHVVFELVIDYQDSVCLLKNFAFYQLGNRLKRLVGYKPLTSLSAQTDTIILDAQKVPVVVAYSLHKLYTILGAGVSAEDKRRYEGEAMHWLGQYHRLIGQHGMYTLNIRLS